MSQQLASANTATSPTTTGSIRDVRIPIVGRAPGTVPQNIIAARTINAQSNGKRYRGSPNAIAVTTPTPMTIEIRTIGKQDPSPPSRIHDTIGHSSDIPGTMTSTNINTVLNTTNHLGRAGLSGQ